MDPRLPQVRALVHRRRHDRGRRRRARGRHRHGRPRAHRPRGALRRCRRSATRTSTSSTGRSPARELDLRRRGVDGRGAAAGGRARAATGWLRGHGWLEAGAGPTARRPAEPRRGHGRPARRALVARPPHALGQLGRASGRPAATGSGIVRERDACDFPLPERTPLEQSRAVRVGDGGGECARRRRRARLPARWRPRPVAAARRRPAAARCACTCRYPAEQIGAARGDSSFAPASAPTSCGSGR